MAHLDKAIKRVEEATHSLSKMQKELNSLVPVFEASKTDVQLRQETVEACQKEYTAAMERCKKQEKDIEDMQIPIELLRKEAQAEFEKVWFKLGCVRRKSLIDLATGVYPVVHIMKRLPEFHFPCTCQSVSLKKNFDSQNFKLIGLLV